MTHADLIRIAVEILGGLVLYLAKSPLTINKVLAGPAETKGAAVNLTQILQLVNLVPTVVSKVEALYVEASSGTKQQLAKDSLMLAAGTFAAIDPADVEATAAVANTATTLIDVFVNQFNQSGIFKHKAAAVCLKMPVITSAPVASSIPAGAATVAPAASSAVVTGPGLPAVSAQ